MARQYYKDSTTGQMKPLGVKVEDTLPVGTEVDYDGQDIPEGWEEVPDDEWHTLVEGCKYRKIGNIVNIQGWIPISPTEEWINNNWRILGSLPQGYRPTDNIGSNIYVLLTNNLYSFDIILHILTDGTVRCSNRSGNTISVMSIYFNETYFVD